MTEVGSRYFWSDDLDKFGVVIALSDSKKSSPTFEVPGILISNMKLSAEIELRAVTEFIPSLVTDLWFDLQSWGIITLNIVYDHRDGDWYEVEFPNDEEFQEILEFKLGSWILNGIDLHIKDFVDWDSLSLNYANFGQQYNEFDTSTPEEGGFLYTTALMGEHEGDLLPNWEALQKALTPRDFDEYSPIGWIRGRISLKNDFPTLNDDLPWQVLRWRKLNPKQQSEIVDHLIATSDNWFLSKYKVITHVLSLIALHPKTDSDVIEKLRELNDEGVQLALKNRR